MELTDNQIERQDEVDNAIFNLLIELDPLELNKEEPSLEWDIEMISEVRDVVFKVLQKAHLKDDITSDEFEMLFYPYIDHSEHGEIDPSFGFVLFIIGLFMFFISVLFATVPF